VRSSGEQDEATATEAGPGETPLRYPVSVFRVMFVQELVQGLRCSVEWLWPMGMSEDFAKVIGLLFLSRVRRGSLGYTAFVATVLS